MNYWNIWSLGRAIFLVICAFPILHFAVRSFKRWLSGRVNIHAEVLIVNLLYYVGVAVIAVAVLHELGFYLNAFLGAAGIVGVAIGFASQTTIENGISGALLLIEQPFRVGDAIEACGIIGKIENMNILSTQIRMSDNNIVRIANAQLLKDRIVNKSRIPVERLCFVIKIDADVHNAIAPEEIKDCAQKSMYCYDKSLPELYMVGIETNAATQQRVIIWRLYVWVLRKNTRSFHSELIQSVCSQSHSNMLGLVAITLE